MARLLPTQIERLLLLSVHELCSNPVASSSDWSRVRLHCTERFEHGVLARLVLSLRNYEHDPA